MDILLTLPAGQCCAGHWHAFIDRDDSGKCSCPGRGHWQKPKKSIHKASRVDNNYPETQFPGLSLPGDNNNDGNISNFLRGKNSKFNSDGRH